jgi:hypothetical protein
MGERNKELGYYHQSSKGRKREKNLKIRDFDISCFRDRFLLQ